jgi:hypothetical protein
MSRPLAALCLGAVVLAGGCGRSSISAQPVHPRATDYSPADRIRVMLPPAGAAGEAAGRIVSARVVEVLQ